MIKKRDQINGVTSRRSQSEYKNPEISTILVRSYGDINKPRNNKVGCNTTSAHGPP